jgi:hypothetical protein
VGEGLTAAEMRKCRWLNPRLFAMIEYLEWKAPTTCANILGPTKNFCV